MEFLCPSCQKMLTVPEQFAGQPMKCPLCGNAFQAPSLAPPSITQPTAETHTYAVASEPEPVRPTPPSPKASYSPPKEPASEKASSAPATTSVSSPLPSEYGRKFTLQVKPQWLPYIPAGALLIIFLLTFFSWVGAFPNGLPVFKQNAWQAAFGSYSVDFEELIQNKDGDNKLKTGVSLLTLFWLLIFLPLLALAVAVVLVPQLNLKVPPAIKQYWPWRMMILCAVSLFLIFLMILLDLMKFPIEDALTDVAKKQVTVTKEKNEKAFVFQEATFISMQGLQRTNTFRLVFFLLIVTVVCALLDFWIEKRGANKPLPRADLLW